MITTSPARPLPATRTEFLLVGAAFFGILAGATLLYRVAPVSGGIYPPCPLHFLTGLHCPGCGSLRALNGLLHGDLPLAFAMNPMLVLLLPVVAFGAASDLALRVRGRPLPGAGVRARWIRALALTLVAFGILRNIPTFPFNVLAPG